jgi:hypothetical protein
MITPLRQQRHQDLQLAGLSEHTHEAYLRAVRQLATHFRLPPDQLTEEQLRQYLLYLKNDKQFAPSSLTIAACGITAGGLGESQPAGIGPSGPGPHSGACRGILRLTWNPAPSRRYGPP